MLGPRRLDGSGHEQDVAVSSERSDELLGPGPARRQVHGDVSGRACESSRQAQLTPAKGLGRDRFVEADASAKAGEVVGDDVEAEPGGVGGETARGQMVEAHAIFEVLDGVLDLGVTAVVGLEVEGVAGPVGDEGVVVELANKASWVPGVGRTRRTISRTLPLVPKGR